MISKKKYSAIVFDLGNVLIPFDLNIFINKINKLQPELGNKFLDFFRSNYELHRDFERGNLPEKEFIEIMLNVFENKIDAETFCREYADIFKVNEDVVSLLPILKKNYKLFLLSNTDSIHKKYGWQKYDFIKHFNKLILSFEVGSVKPEEKIYREVEAASGFPSEEHFFIDDIEEYVEGAKRVGWDAVQFVDYQKLIIDLKEREILE